MLALAGCVREVHISSRLEEVGTSSRPFQYEQVRESNRFLILESLRQNSPNVREQIYCAQAGQRLSELSFSHAISVLANSKILVHPDIYPVQFVVPFGRNEHFTGRRTILDQLLTRIPPDSNCDTCQRTVLHGLGGVGKTQIALEAIYRLHHQDSACSIFWVSAQTFTIFENGYRNIARTLRIPGFDDFQEDAKSLVKEALSQEARAGTWAAHLLPLS